MMDKDTIEGAATDIVGKGKEGFGKAIGDRQLQDEGFADQVAGTSQKTVGRLKEFARKRPVLATTLAGVLGVALLNTLRGK